MAASSASDTYTKLAAADIVGTPNINVAASAATTTIVDLFSGFLPAS
jgi:hypothetical protein